MKMQKKRIESTHSPDFITHNRHFIHSFYLWKMNFIEQIKGAANLFMIRFDNSFGAIY